MYDRILLPTDGSPTAEQASQHAFELANRFDAALDVVSVVNPGALGPDVRAATILDQLERSAQETVDDVVERAGDAGIGEVTGAVGEGIPHRAILEYADDQDADLIVMGTHGRSGLQRYLIGSVTEKVVRAADVPVVTVPKPAENDETESE
jgi:nucleotide-binding universal stress UspA family protein